MKNENSIMNNTYIKYIIVAMYLFYLSGCQNEQENTEVLNQQRESIYKDYGEGKLDYLYCVFGDTILVYKYGGGRLSAPKDRS